MREGGREGGREGKRERQTDINCSLSLKLLFNKHTIALAVSGIHPGRK